MKKKIVFFSGASGTGKSTALQQVLDNTLTHQPVMSVGRRFITDMDKQRSTTKAYFKLSLKILQASIKEFYRNTSKYTRLIFERSPVDSLCYLYDAADRCTDQFRDTHFVQDCLFQKRALVKKVMDEYVFDDNVYLFLPNDKMKMTDVVIRGSQYASEQKHFTARLESAWDNLFGIKPLVWDWTLGAEDNLIKEVTGE